MSEIQLTRLEIKRKNWGPHEGRLLAKIDIENDSTRYEVQLSPEFSDKVIELCKEELVKELKSSTNDFIHKILAGLTFSALEGGENE